MGATQVMRAGGGWVPLERRPACWANALHLKAMMKGTRGCRCGVCVRGAAVGQPALGLSTSSVPLCGRASSDGGRCAEANAGSRTGRL